MQRPTEQQPAPLTADALLLMVVDYLNEAGLPAAAALLRAIVTGSTAIDRHALATLQPLERHFFAGCLLQAVRFTDHPECLIAADEVDALRATVGAILIEHSLLDIDAMRQAQQQQHAASLSPSQQAPHTRPTAH
jgi:hypothetical protein